MLELHIPSIVCEGCLDTITKAILAVDEKAKIQGDLATKIVTVETTASLDTLRTVITEKGHTLA